MAGPAPAFYTAMAVHLSVTAGRPRPAGGPAFIPPRSSAMDKKPEPEAADHRTLTTRQGHPVTNNQSQRTVGSRGPATLENYHFLEKISHFDRERIPERVVHARGFVATASSRRPADRRRAGIEVHAGQLFQEAGKKTPLAIRFSTVIGGRDSSEVGARPARVRGEVLHRGRQLGPRRQQPGGVLHPRRDQVSRRHPLAEAGPGDVPAGAEPDLRLHEPDARVACTCSRTCSAPAAFPRATGTCRVSA